MADGNITKDVMYDAVAPDDFESMLELDRYNARSTAFDKIISATHDHFWDPLDPKYIDFSEPWDMENEPLLPDDQVMALGVPYVLDHLEKTGQKVKFINEMVLWNFSSILHGEQGALNLSASLCHVLKDQGAQEYAANQTREEARHVTGFSRYIATRFGAPLAAGPTLASLMDEIVQSGLVYQKLVGMQMLIEGLAMGAFATLYSSTEDPLLRRLVQLVMTDEAFHHKFGKIWADKTIPLLSEQEHEKVEQWAADTFQVLLFNLVNAEQKQTIYEPFGLEWQWVRSAVLEAFSDADRRVSMTRSTNIFRVLIKTLLKAGIITERTKHIYAQWVDMDELAAEDNAVVAADVVDAGIAELREINRNRNRVGRRFERA